MLEKTEEQGEAPTLYGGILLPSVLDGDFRCLEPFYNSPVPYASRVHTARTVLLWAQRGIENVEDHNHNSGTYF